MAHADLKFARLLVLKSKQKTPLIYCPQLIQLHEALKKKNNPDAKIPSKRVQILFKSRKRRKKITAEILHGLCCSYSDPAQQPSKLCASPHFGVQR